MLDGGSLDLRLDLAHALDPVSFAEDRLGFKPDTWQGQALRATASWVMLNCCRQMGLDQESVRLLVGGLIDRQSALSAELYKYFLQIHFEEIDESIKITDELKELPLHYFSSILKMAVCA